MSLIFGILASFFALFFQGVGWIVYPDLFSLQTPVTISVILALFFLAFTEEVARVLFSNQYLKNASGGHFLGGALLFGIGFALLEIVLTFWNTFSWHVLVASFFHLTATVLTFWWLKENRTTLSIVILIPLLTALHFFFNLTLLNTHLF